MLKRSLSSALPACPPAKSAGAGRVLPGPARFLAFSLMIAGLLALAGLPVQAAPVVTETGHAVTTWASSSSLVNLEHMAFDQKGNLLIAARTQVLQVAPNKMVTSYLTGMNKVYGLGVGPDGLLYLPDSQSEGSAFDGQLYYSTGAGVKKMFASGSPLVDPLGMAFAPAGFGSVAGKLLVADWNALGGPGAVFSIDPMATTPTPTVFAQSTGFATPTDVKFAPGNKLYAVDESNGFFGISPTGVVTLMAAGKFTGMTIHPTNGDIFVTGANGIDIVYRITPGTSTATVTQLATGFSDLSDGSAGLTFTPDGTTLLVADNGAHIIYAFAGFQSIPTQIDDDLDGYTEFQGDCVDTDKTIYPGAIEVCDGIDQNCNGQIDEGFDVDADGYYKCARSGKAADCNDNSASVYPGALEVPYDGIDQDCSGADLTDVDQDGYPATQAGGTDCNDQSQQVYPGAPETCGDGIDQNCSGADLSCADVDGDGDGYTPNQGDCQDQNSSVHPGVPEVCQNALDDDCNGQVDDGFDGDGDGHLSSTTCSGGDDCADQDATVYPGAAELCNGKDEDCDSTLDEGFPDLDQDGKADCVDSDKDGDGYASDVDCVDTDASIKPGALELCDAIDNNCNGSIDEGFDLDGDGHLVIAGCEGLSGDDCDDGWAATYPGATELCDGRDNDCDGTVDEGYADLDHDGHADCIDQDADGDGYAAGGSSPSDCNDLDPDIYPGAEEACDGIDQDCDGVADNGFDADGDGHTDGLECALQGGDDCNDASGGVYPGASETCNGVDDNCSGQADESFDQDGDEFSSCAFVTQSVDCDDAQAGVYPGATEVCGDEIDQDCDGVDETCGTGDDDATGGDDDATGGDDDATAGDDDATAGDDDATGGDDDATGGDDDATGGDDDATGGDDGTGDGGGGCGCDTEGSRSAPTTGALAAGVMGLAMLVRRRRG